MNFNYYKTTINPTQRLKEYLLFIPMVILALVACALWTEEFQETVNGDGM